MSEEKINTMKNLAKKILIPVFDKESQLGRSFYSLNKDKKFTANFKRELFNKKLVENIEILRKKIDDGTLKNQDIRKSILKLSGKTGAMPGQSQKVINVYLKFYCLFLNKPYEMIKELDCPLDSNVMRRKLKINKTMKGIWTMMDYNSIQRLCEKEGSGTRLAADLFYDKQRINNYLKAKNSSKNEKD